MRNKKTINNIKTILNYSCYKIPLCIILEGLVIALSVSDCCHFFKILCWVRDHSGLGCLYGLNLGRLGFQFNKAQFFLRVVLTARRISANLQQKTSGFKKELKKTTVSAKS